VVVGAGCGLAWLVPGVHRFWRVGDICFETFVWFSTCYFLEREENTILVELEIYDFYFTWWPSWLGLPHPNVMCATYLYRSQA
jgi:hypothetical protein